MVVRIITPKELAELQREKSTLELIDVRTPVEFQEVHVAGAKNVPLDRLDPHVLLRDRKCGSTEPLYVICRSGNRANGAAEKLASLGADVVNVEGGTLACEQAGLPMVRGKKSMSLERQIRIAAGSLVLLGVVLAWLVHPYFVLLPAVIGVGLVFSGVTDTCGMGLMLAQMPWNRIALEPTKPSQCQSDAPTSTKACCQ